MSARSQPATSNSAPLSGCVSEAQEAAFLEAAARPRRRRDGARRQPRAVAHSSAHTYRGTALARGVAIVEEALARWWR
eukprot:scaffold99164_cov45-Phaeocystis_antarctica.AAC.1